MDRKTPMLKRIEDAIIPVPESGCWLWTKRTDRGGYGWIKIDGIHRAAHRVVWEFYNGPIPNGMKACHKCDTPLCVNPNHIFLGSQGDNLRDMFGKGRWKTKRVVGDRSAKSCTKGHGQDTWRVMDEFGGGRCLTCERIRDKDRYRKKMNRILSESDDGRLS